MTRWLTCGALCIALAAQSLILPSPHASAQNLIGLNFTTAGSATPNPQNWTRISAPDGSVSNLMDETGATTSVGVNYGGGASGGFVYLGTSTLAPDAVPQYSYSLAGMTGYGFRSDGQFFVEFTGLAPNTPYEYWFVAYRGGSAIDNLVRVSNGDTIDAFSFNQFITAANNDSRFLINSTISSNSQNWNDLSFVTTSSSTGTLRFNWAVQSQTPVIGALAIRQAAVIPEPSTFALLGGVSMLMLGGLRRRRK